MTFFEICLDEISYDTPYLQVCTEKKVFENIFFLEKSPVQPLSELEEHSKQLHLEGSVINLNISEMWKRKLCLRTLQRRMKSMILVKEYMTIMIDGDEWQVNERSKRNFLSQLYKVF